MKNKRIIAIDLVLIVGTLIVLGSLYSYMKPVALSPPGNAESVLFEFEGDTVWIDDNLEFSSPIIIDAERGEVVNLEPGLYYFKIVGEGVSEIKWVRVVSGIDLRIADGKIVNVGDEELNVDYYESIEDTRPSESFVLGMGGEDE